MTTTSAETSSAPDRIGSDLQRTARTTGLLYLGFFITGIVGSLIVRAQLFAADDPHGTLSNLMEHESLARVGIALELCIALFQALTAVWFYRLFRGVDGYLVQNPIGKLWATPGVILSEFSAVIPDLVFVSNERLDEIASGDRITGAPDLVIEIVSPGAENARRDRLAKRQLYGKHGVKEYWIVDFESRTIEVYLLQGQTLVLKSRLTEQDELTSAMLPGYHCRVATIFSI